ncbi:T9SS type A sorting domain-containing protein [Winogradskyella sp. 3972H.M.0a.05]|uniref:T9SS type A sorting domain-containing protein n=1 Tax=Winogradskyella sp. 3972H.M.0a.05 TaxID=2950277 RepID=UPI00339844D8
MKKTTLFVILCLASFVLHSQIDLTQDFDNGAQGWDTNTFFFISINPCSGTSARKSIFSTATSGDMQSPNVVGQSNGNDLSVSLDYKIVDWGLGTIATQPGWGHFDIQYSTDDGSNWVTIETIDDSNHVTSNQCANLSYTVSGGNIPAGSDFKFRINATYASGDYFLYIDDIVISQSTSQAPPVNDDIANAITLEVGAVYDDHKIDGTVLGATMDSQSAGCGVDGPGVWYRAVVPSNGSLMLETGMDSNDTSGFDSVIEVFSGPMNNLVSIGCNDESDNTEGNYSLVELTTLTPGEMIYIRVWEDGGDEAEPFAISAYGDTLSIGESELENVTLFPNPMKNVLNVNSLSNIDTLVIYDVLGQAVKKIKNINSGTQLDLSNLRAGAYIAVLSIDNAKRTIKLIKQ